MNEAEQRKRKKEIEQEAIELIKTLNWYQAAKKPNKASVLVEDVLPIIVMFVGENK